MSEIVLTGALIVLPDATLQGTLVLRDGRVADIQPGSSAVPGALDVAGDILLPGLVDLHTDNLERQVEPRAGARWPSRSALLAHDAQCAAAGVTTVLDALCVGDLGFDSDRVRTMRQGLADLDAMSGTGLLKAEHFLHLRCELPAEGMPQILDGLADHPLLRMVSLMDHSPGVGQYYDMEFYRRVRRRGGASEAVIEQRIAQLIAQRARLRGPNRRALLQRMAGRAVTLASHDDRTTEEIAENAADGIGVSEFPVTLQAAQAAHRAGMRVIAGAPNVVRGGSHSGNVAASTLLDAGAVDSWASDYVPHALIEAAFVAAARGTPLPEAVAMVTAAPAAMAGLDDRGRLQPGLRADLLRVRLHDAMPVVRAVWRQGERVA